MSSQTCVPVLRRAICLLESLAHREGVSAKTLAGELGIPPATCYRILATFAAARWVRRDARGGYHLSQALGLVGGLARRMGVVLPLLAQPLKQLAESTRLTAKVTIREGAEWLMIARHELPKDIAVSQRVGMRAPIYVGSVGAVLLFNDDDAQIRRLLLEAKPAAAKDTWRRIHFCRQRRYAADLGETHPSVHALSVPVDLGFVDSTAALTAFGLPDEVPAMSAPAVVQKLRATAREIGASLTTRDRLAIKSSNPQLR